MLSLEDLETATPHVARSMAGVVQLVLRCRGADLSGSEPALLALDGMCQQIRNGRDLGDFATASMFSADPEATAQHFGAVVDRLIRRRETHAAAIPIAAAELLSREGGVDVDVLRARSFADALGESARRVGYEMRSLREAVETAASRYRLAPIRRTPAAGAAYLTIDQEFSAQARRLDARANRLLSLGAALASPAEDHRWSSVEAMHHELHREFSQVDAVLTGLRSLLRQCDRDAYFSGVGPRFPSLTTLPVETCECGTSSSCDAGEREAPDLPLSTARAVARAVRLREASSSTRRELRAALQR
ncbi:hypothetical protein [Leifsonia shinshuensis]